MFTIVASLLFVCISFPDVATQGDGHPRDTRLLLDGERTLVDQVAALTNKVTALTNKVAALEAKDNTEVAFEAHLSKSISNFGANQHVVFDQVQLNTGNAYNNIHGAFTAPVAGTYLLAMHVCSGHGHYVHMEMVRNTDVIATALAGDQSYYSCTDKTTVVVLKVGDVVFVRHHLSLGDYLDSETYDYTSFMGVLLR